jgi:hypothetical protein
MTAWQAVQSLIALLDDVVPAGHVSGRRPAATGDLPALAVSAAGVTDIGSGLGGLVETRRLSDTAWASVTATRCTGVLTAELWAAGDVGPLADAVVAALADAAAVGAAGFLMLSVESVGAIDEAALGFAGDDTALRLPLGLAFVHETPVSEDTGPGGIVKTIHVDLQDDFHEVMDLP